MKTTSVKHALLVLVVLLLSQSKGLGNGCTGSWFDMQYSPWCNCWQVCGNYISDCDEIVSLSWNFGDGTTATGESPCHTYAQPGTYTVTMTIVAYCHNSFFNLFTSTCHITKQITVTNTIPTLQAGFTVDTTCEGTATHFQAAAITPSGSNSYTWIMPDGTVLNGGSPTYTFDSCGAYDVMMIVSNTTPCCSIAGTDTVVQRVYVNCPPFSESNQLGDNEPYIQESSAFLSVTSGTCPGDTTRFLITPNGALASWEFVFPDSSTSTATNPWYVYTNCPPAVDYTYVKLYTNRNCPGIIDSVTGIFCPSNINPIGSTTLCSGQCSGFATVTLGGGTPPYTVEWSDPNNQTTTTATGLCPGNYTVTVTDGNGCTASPAQPATVVDFPFPFVGTPTILSNIPCNGWSGGSAVLNYSGGTPPYSTFWSNGATTDSVSGLFGGPITVTGTDANGCVFTTTIIIPEPPPITATINATNTACGTCNGSATVNASGGHGSYSYIWLTTPSQNTQTATGLCSGVYQVIVEDATVAGCRDTFSVTINENGAQPITTTATNATCPNICNGTATVNFTGGCANPPCTVQWLDSAGTPIGQATPTATGLCTGTYIARVVNAAGCNSYSTVSVNVPNPIVPSATATVNTCGANCNGSIVATGTGGNQPYTYQWFQGGNPLGGQTGPTLANACTGTYTVQFTDQQGCIATASASVYANPFNATATATSVLCNGDCNGIVTAIATGGTMPYTYTLQSAGGATVYTGPSNIIANLCAGSYTLIATDSSGCPINIPININQPPALNPLPTGTNPLCHNDCNGSLAVTVTGGTAPYRYEWRNSTGQLLPGGSTPSVANRCAGNYVVQVTDTNGCVSPFVPVALVNPALVDDSIQVIDPYCDGGQGSINLTPYGGTPPYTFNWNNGQYTTEDISGLSSGTFTVLITDVNGCTARDTVTFTLLPLLNIHIDTRQNNGYDFKCFGGRDGGVMVRVSGGLPPYTYQWNDSLQTTIDSIYGLGPGTYTVTVTDANGCVRVDSVSLNRVPPPYSISETHQDVLCADAANGSITVTPIGGIQPYTAFWAHDTALFSTQITNLDTGSYIVYVFDSVFCLRVDTITITQPTALQISNSVTDALCSGLNNGSVNLTVNGGVQPYFYNWNNGAYTTEDIDSLAGGVYVVVVTDSNNCTIADTATVNQPPGITTTIVTTDATCFNGNNGSVNLTASGGTPPYNFNWNNGQYTVEDPQGLAAGIYILSLTDQNGCAASDTATISEPPIITGSRNVQICVTDSFFAGGAYQNTAGTYYDTLVNNVGCDSVLATNLTLINQFNSTFAETVCFGQGYYYNGMYYTAAGNYVDTLTSAAGCDSVVTFTLSVLPDINLYAVPNTARLVTGDTVALNLITANPGEIITYTWSPSTGLSCSDCPDPIAQPGADTRYVAMVVDSNGCMDTVVIPVFVSGPVLFIPNVFTPNGDGANDFFQLYGNIDAIRYMEVQIFNRWGEKVFESNNHQFKWDGTYKGKPQTQAVFVYTVKVTFNNDLPEKLYKGSVTLLR